ncbi:MAG TPA: TIGR02466 family protein [Dongiaceae bacterium]|jgi:uncharacterized protein (TIGR02466 family)|nr:TIGR02466 family protein [Dongiaceae bacterium]
MNQQPGSTMASIFADLSVKDLFPTPIWLADVDPDLAARLNPELETAIKELIEPRPQIPIGSTWQTAPVLHRHERFGEFCGLVRKAGAAAIAFLDLKHRDFEITGCWANINPTGGLNSPHTHPNNFLSGVYYVSLPANSGHIVFADPRPQAAGILPPAENWNKYVGNEIKLEVKEGRMVIFPAWLVHSVPVNRSAEERISISFNLMFKDFTESVSKPLWSGSAPIRR